jgi:hypothetical protein
MLVLLYAENSHSYNYSQNTDFHLKSTHYFVPSDSIVLSAECLKTKQSRLLVEENKLGVNFLNLHIFFEFRHLGVTLDEVKSFEK